MHWKDATGAHRMKSFKIERSADAVVSQLGEQGAGGVRKEDRWSDPEVVLRVRMQMPSDADGNFEVALAQVVRDSMRQLHALYEIDLDAIVIEVESPAR